jgi:hypothetical protein
MRNDTSTNKIIQINNRLLIATQKSYHHFGYSFILNFILSSFLFYNLHIRLFFRINFPLGILYHHHNIMSIALLYNLHIILRTNSYKNYIFFRKTMQHSIITLIVYIKIKINRRFIWHRLKV